VSAKQSKKYIYFLCLGGGSACAKLKFGAGRSAPQHPPKRLGEGGCIPLPLVPPPPIFITGSREGFVCIKNKGLARGRGVLKGGGLPFKQTPLSSSPPIYLSLVVEGFVCINKWGRGEERGVKKEREFLASHVFNIYIYV